MRPYHALRAALYGGGVTHDQLARRLRIGTATVSRKLNARSPWTLTECYQVMDRLPEREPHHRGHAVRGAADYPRQ